MPTTAMQTQDYLILIARHLHSARYEAIERQGAYTPADFVRRYAARYGTGDLRDATEKCDPVVREWLQEMLGQLHDDYWRPRDPAPKPTLSPHLRQALTALRKAAAEMRTGTGTIARGRAYAAEADQIEQAALMQAGPRSTDTCVHGVRWGPTVATCPACLAIHTESKPEEKGGS
ncbi:MAG: hypothetical protein V3W41_14530 [Planctomycetota bacterium]